MSSELEIERHCSLNKKPGIVQLSSSHLVWTPDSAAHGSEVRIALCDIRSFQVSKEGASKKALLRLMVANRTDKPTLDFAGSFADRDSIRDSLNRLQAPAAASAVASPPSTIAPKSSTPTSTLSAEELGRRRTLLQRKEVVKLHASVVRSGAVSDEAFWKAMRYRYKDNGEPRARCGPILDDVDDGQTMGNGSSGAGVGMIRGVPSDAFSTEAGVTLDGRADAMGLSTWTSVVPTAAQRHQVFMAKGAIGRAYRETVRSGKMEEEKFWTLFKASSIGRVGTTGRLNKTDTAKTAEADAMFAPFESAERRLAEGEKKTRGELVARELALERRDGHVGTHLQECHGGGGTEEGMVVAGRDMSSGVKLMRTVNRHGGMVLDESGVQRMWVGEAVDKVRPLEDLVGEKEEAWVKLGMQGEDGLVGKGRSRTGRSSGLDGGWEARVEGCEEMWEMLEDWEADVSRFREAGDSGTELDALLATMRA